MGTDGPTVADDKICNLEIPADDIERSVLPEGVRLGDHGRTTARE